MTAGLVLLAHGARDAAWRVPFDAVADRVRASAPDLDVRLAFLELMQPDLTAAGEALAHAGCVRVGIVPLFLGMGGHVRRDVPDLVARLRARYPAVQWILHDAVGETAGVIAALAEAALAAAGAPASASTSLPAPHAQPAGRDGRPA